MTATFLSRRGLLAGAAAGLGLAACSPTAPGPSASPSQSPTAGPSPSATLGSGPIVFGMTYIPNVQFSPLYVARDHGIFADLGLDVQLRHHGQQEDAFGALVSGQEQVVLASSDEAVVAAANGASVATFATCYQRFPAEVMTALPLPGDPLQVLRGARLGIPGHYGSSYYAALCALHQAGLSEDEAGLTDVGYTQVAALSTGKVESIVGYLNNELVQFRALGMEVSSVPVTDPAAPSLVGPGLIAAPGILAEEQLRGLREAVLEAEKLIAADPEVGLVATEKEVPTLSEPDQRAAAEAVLVETIGLWKGERGEVHLDVDEAAFARMGQLLTEVGIIDAAPGEPLLLI
ncbi:MAG TPA: ABC transporter substrate-binding protein [Arachnia sp.]|nr:ABC transporter substrate-binding protein [Arachnia sp.]HMT85684.1 ABC transporter substrate-binding protein [Arachnia sp.]